MKKTVQKGIIVSISLLIGMIAIALIAPGYFIDAAKVPVHWGMDGTPDRFADASEAMLYLWLMPLILAFTAGLFGLLPLIEPLRANLQQSQKAFLAIWMSVAVLLTFTQIGIAAGMTGLISEEAEMVRFIIAATGLMFVVLGNYLPKTRQSFFMGIRTPWTLTSETSWEKTHKRGGKLFMLAGSLSIVSAFFVNGIALALVLPTLVIGSVLYLAVYSYLVWRSADDQSSSPDYLV